MRVGEERRKTNKLNNLVFDFPNQHIIGKTVAKTPQIISIFNTPSSIRESREYFSEEIGSQYADQCIIPYNTYIINIRDRLN